jgi:RNA polymerase subunit RPABC4/transcription elongation factor Spt4
MSSKICHECKSKVKSHILLCLKCNDQLVNKKFEDLYLVLAKLNNTLVENLKEKEVLENKIKLLEDEKYK